MRVQRQAVVVVHGIGEQVPLETLRGFVLGDGPNAPAENVGVVMGKARVFSEASPVAATCEDRIYSARWVHDRRILDCDELTQRTGDDRLSVSHLSDSDVRTDFYEFYWAPRYRDSTVGSVVSWAFKLLRRPRKNYSSAAIKGPDARVRRVFLFVFIFAALGSALAGRVDDDLSARACAVVAIALLLGALLLGTHLGLLTTFRTLLGVTISAFLVGVVLLGTGWVAVATSFLTGGLFGAVLVVAGGLVARTLGDAARYLSNGPSSVEENERIQTGVLSLLEQLHDQCEDDGSRRYERIVVVGHSLGGVIAYDAVTLLWQRRHHKLFLPEPGSTTQVGRAVEAVEMQGTAIHPAVDSALPQKPQDPNAWLRYRQAQSALCVVLRNGTFNPDRTTPTARSLFGRAVGDQRRRHAPKASRTPRSSPSRAPSPIRAPAPPAAPSSAPPTAPPSRWIITDLVTVGAPLTYADAFLAVSDERLEERFIDRGLHQCPPMPQRSVAASAHPYRSRPPARRGLTTTYLHQGATFAVVRWTNRWFGHDIVGGPVAPHFGYGVDDQQLPGKKKWIGWFLIQFPHTSYWRHKKRRKGNREGTTACRQLLHDVIYRPPVYVMTCVPPGSDERLTRLVDLLTRPAEAPSLVEVDVRLQVGLKATPQNRTPLRVPAYLPVDKSTLPTAVPDRDIEKLLGRGTELVFGTDPLQQIEKTFPDPCPGP